MEHDYLIISSLPRQLDCTNPGAARPVAHIAMERDSTVAHSRPHDRRQAREVAAEMRLGGEGVPGTLLRGDAHQEAS